MRTAIFTLLSLGTLLAFAGCDTEDDLLLDDDGALVDGDEPVSFRCVGEPCLQSPYVGSFDLSNMSENSTGATSPDGLTTVTITGITKNGGPMSHMQVTDYAECQVRQASTAPWQNCVGVILTLDIVRNGTHTTGQIKIEGVTVDSTGPIDVFKYGVKGNLNPLSNVPSEKFEYYVCPEGDDGTRKLVMLPDVQSTWVVNNDNGLGELVESTKNKFTLACTGYAMAKGYTRGKVLPVTTDTRMYGIAGYNAFTHAMRALLRRHGTTNQYDALTQQGTYIIIKDVQNNPPLFDEAYQSPPIIGYGFHLLESVYNASGAVQSGRKGATCKKSYDNVPCSGTGELEFPNGIHRRPEYSPPMTTINGWSSLPDCDLNNLGSFGSVAVYEWYEGQCVPQW